MGGEAGVHEETFFVIPFFEAAVVEQLQVILDNEGNDIVLQTLFKEDQAAYAAISVLEGMDAFEGHMEGYDVLKGLRGQCIVLCQQLAYLLGNILLVEHYFVGLAAFCSKIFVAPSFSNCLSTRSNNSLPYPLPLYSSYI